MFVIWSDDTADKLIIRCRVVRDPKSLDEDADAEEDQILKRIEAHMLESISLRGIPGITRVFMMQHKVSHPDETGEFKQGKEWVLETDGVNLADVMAVPGVDSTRTYSNDFIEVLSVLGIEATRSSLYKEILNVIAFDGSYVNYRHMALLVDVMTSRGHLMAITRHGINRSDTGALMRCSFEETVEILLDAAAAAELDDCKGISENVMLGQMAPLGTGSFDLMVDDRMLQKAPSSMAMDDIADGGATPYKDYENARDENIDIDAGAGFSPIHIAQMNEGNIGGLTSYGGQPTSPAATSPFSYGYNSITSPGYTSPGYGYSPTSPLLTNESKLRSNESCILTNESKLRSNKSCILTNESSYATSPAYSPTSPAYSPTSPSYYHHHNTHLLHQVIPNISILSNESKLFSNESCILPPVHLTRQRVRLFTYSPLLILTYFTKYSRQLTIATVFTRHFRDMSQSLLRRMKIRLLIVLYILVV